MEKRQVTACAFDLGNTLINDTQLAGDAIGEMGDWLLDTSAIESRQPFLATYARINQDTNRPFISHTFGEIDFFEKTFKELAITAVTPEEALKKYREIVTTKIHPDKDVEEAFRLLKQKNIRLALLSNESVSRVDAYMEKTKLRHFFDTIIVSEDIGVEKPDLLIFQEALNRLNVAGEETVMFGDNDIADGAGKNLGILFVLVTGYKNRDWAWEEGNSYQPDYIMKKITKKNMGAFLDTVCLNR